jgi:hypothetical protein
VAFAAVAVSQLSEWETRQPIRWLIGAVYFAAIAIPAGYSSPWPTFIVLGTAAALFVGLKTYRWQRRVKAVGQLRDLSSPVPVRGIYTLRAIGMASDSDRATIIDMLGLIIRERSKVKRKREDKPPKDVLAALRVAGQLLRISGVTLDPRGADLRDTDLSELPNDQVLLERANVQEANLPEDAVK